MTLPPALWWRALLAAAAVLALLLLWGQAAVQAALPAVRWAIELLAPELHVQTLVLERTPNHGAADHVVRLQVAVQQTLVLDGRAHLPAPGSTAQASTLALQCLHGPALALWLALAWPGCGAACRWVPRLGRVLAVCALAVLLVLIDLPVVLAGAVWQLLVDQLAPGESSVLLAWKNFISHGGRLALGVAVGAGAILVTRRFAAPQTSRFTHQS